MKLKEYLKKRALLIDGALDTYLPRENQVPAILHRAIRYSVFGKAKRIRPILTLAVSDLVRGNLKKALIPACAIEMIHASSLVHDDLPSMDNDDYRRGRLSCHKKYGEAYAILVGDSLLIEAFHLIAKYPDPKRAACLSSIISDASGSRGMVGGQTIEKIWEGKDVDLPTLNLIHINKTGKLFVAACLAGAVSGGASAGEIRQIRRFSECVGLAFQIVDDIIDRDGFLKFMSESEARFEADRLITRAATELKPFGKKASVLLEIADLLAHRSL